HVRPLLNEKYTPVSPTPRLNVPSGNEQAPCSVEASWEHGCMSTSSFAPAASTVGRDASTASAGSFWAFWGWTPCGLPTLTRALVAESACAGMTASATNRKGTAAIESFFIGNTSGGIARSGDI